MGELTNIINNPSFRRVAACLRPATVVSVRMKHPDLPLATLADRFAKLSFNDPLIRSNPAQYFEAFDKLAAAVAKITQRLIIPANDYEWLSRQIGSTDGPLVAAMLAGYFYAKEGRFVTPLELAGGTKDAERTWRERAECGDIPGAIKKGKQWLLPFSVVEVMYHVDLSAITTESDPDELPS